MRPRFEIDWEVWALPLCIGWIDGQFLIVRLGPLSWHWGNWRNVEDALERAEKRLAELGWDK